MLVLTAFGEQIQCDKAVRGTDSVLCYKGNTVVSRFGGISDFSEYHLEDVDGNPVDFALAENTTNAYLEQQITNLQMAIVELYEGMIANG